MTEEVPSRDEHSSHHHVTKWKAAALRTRDLTDPWKELGFDQIEEESVVRHMYSPHTGKWKTDKVVIKIQSEVCLSSMHPQDSLLASSHLHSL